MLTRGAQGSVVFRHGARTDIAPVPTRVVDSTGAGDAYAAGFLAGLAQGLPVAACGHMGSVAASEVIGHFGARPEADLRALLAGPRGFDPLKRTRRHEPGILNVQMLSCGII